MAKRPLSLNDLEIQFRDQIGTLQRSVQLFDDGYHVEARKMAVILRVLFHTGRYPSLLSQLGREAQPFVDTSPEFDPENLLSFHGLLSLRFDDSGVSFVAKLDDGSVATRKPFSEWWNGTVFSDGQKRKLSRSEVVRTAADQDGGAHVEDGLREDYAALRYENALGWITDQGNPPFGDPCYFAIRQISHEVLKTFLPSYTKTNEEVRANWRKSEISGGKMRFYPHEKQFFKTELKSPLTPGAFYLAEVAIDSITAGSVRMIVNSTASEPVTSAGVHKMVVEAGQEANSGVFGEYTDAIIDRVSIREVIAGKD